MIFTIKVALLLGAVAIFCKVFLVRCTFFNLNRYYCLMGMSLALTTPLLPLDWDFQLGVANGRITFFSNLVTSLEASIRMPTKSAEFDVWKGGIVVWTIGFAFHLVGLCFRYIPFLK